MKLPLRYELDVAEMFADLVGDPDAWQAKALRSESKRQLWLCSRQAGKSSVASILGLHTALYEDGSLVLMVSPSLPQSQELFRKAVAGYRDLGYPVGAEAMSALRLELRNGSRIVSLPGSSTTVTGYTATRVLLDEAVRTSSDLVESIMPTVAASGGSVIALSSAGPSTGWFYNLWHMEGAEEVWEKFTATAADCPRIPASVLEEARLLRGSQYMRREFYCEWGQEEDAWIAPELVDRAFTLVDTSEPLWSSRERNRLS